MEEWCICVFMMYRRASRGDGESVTSIARAGGIEPPLYLICRSRNNVGGKNKTFY